MDEFSASRGRAVLRTRRSRFVVGLRFGETIHANEQVGKLGAKYHLVRMRANMIFKVVRCRRVLAAFQAISSQ